MEAKKIGGRATEYSCGYCGYFMPYAGRMGDCGDCANVAMNKESNEYRDGELTLQVSFDEEPCALFRSKPPPKRVLEYMKQHPQLYQLN